MKEQESKALVSKRKKNEKNSASLVEVNFYDSHSRGARAVVGCFAA
jgi:hypothetical protein